MRELGRRDPVSFGLRDEDWVDPDPSRIVKCRDCEEWVVCPCGCGMGWCNADGEFTDEEHECEF